MKKTLMKTAYVGAIGLSLILGGNALKKQSVHLLVDSMKDYYSAIENKADAKTLKNLESKMKFYDSLVPEINLKHYDYALHKDFMEKGYFYGKDGTSELPFIFNIQSKHGNICYCDLKRGFVSRETANNVSAVSIGENIGIFLPVIARDAKLIASIWPKIVENNEYFKKNDERWIPEFQAIYNTFKDYDQKRIAEAYICLAIDESIMHEQQHLTDMGKFPLEDMEKRAFLRQLTNSPIYLSTIRKIASQNGNLSNAAKSVYSALVDGMTEKEFYNLSNSEISEKAAKLLKEF